MKINYQRTTYIFAIAFVLSLLVTMAVLAGSLDAPSAPTDSASQMYTLEQIYELMTTGSTTDKMSTFGEPANGPGTGTMYTLDEIMTAAQDNRCHCECAGCTLNGTRWCDNGDGTVTDLLGYSGVGQCLEWAQDASWGGEKPWRDPDNYDDAHVRARMYGSLTDHRWRLPTRAELYALTHGTDAVLSGTPRAFTGVQSDRYWSSTSVTGNAYRYAAYVLLSNGNHNYSVKHRDYYVWPVRGGQ